MFTALTQTPIQGISELIHIDVPTIVLCLPAVCVHVKLTLIIVYIHIISCVYALNRY